MGKSVSIDIGSNLFETLQQEIFEWHTQAGIVPVRIEVAKGVTRNIEFQFTYFEGNVKATVKIPIKTVDDPTLPGTKARIWFGNRNAE